MSNEALLQVVDPSGHVVTVKRRSLKKAADGTPILKPGWTLLAPEAKAPTGKK